MIFFKYLDKKKIYLLIIFNLAQWFIFYDVAEIKYKEKDICLSKEAIGYDFKFSIKKGLLLEHFTNKNDMINCYSQFMGVYSDNFSKSKPLRLSN